MRKHLVLTLLCFLSNVVYTQELKVGFSYKYLYSRQWDKAIQTYNFSRPFLEEKQPLLINGMNSSVSYLFKTPHKVKHGINLTHSYFRSVSENENFNSILNLHFLNLGYILHIENKRKLTGLYTDILISATTSGLFRHINGEPILNDQTSIKAFGVGGDLKLKLGYYFQLKGNSFISPFIAISYTPYMFSPNSESLLNQTKGLTSKTWTSVLTSQVGFAFHIKKNE